MDLNEINPDIIARYKYILKKRMSDRQKKKFIVSLIKDLSIKRDDIHVIETTHHNSKNAFSRNIYVGDVESAEWIIATYYDTYAAHLGSFTFNNISQQKQKTLLFNLISSLLLMVIGIIFTVYITVPFIDKAIENSNWLLIGFIVVFYIIISWAIGKVAKGIASRHTWIRNSATVVFLINDILNQSENKRIAYAFVDNGTTNEQGLESLLNSVNKNSKILYLDSIGAKADLTVSKDNNISLLKKSTVFSAGINKIYPGQYGKLSSKDLHSKEIYSQNFVVVQEILDKVNIER